MDYLPYIKLQSYCCFCYCIVCQLLMVLLHCSLNIPADAVGSMSKLENCSFNTNTFHHILKVCFLIYFDLLFMNIFLSLSLTLFVSYACLHTWSDSDGSVLSLCCLTRMFYSRDHMCGVAFQEQVKLWQFALPHCFLCI